MIYGPGGSEEEKLINKISVLERRMISARYDGKVRKFKRLKRKYAKLQSKYDIQFGGKRISGIDKWKRFIKRTKPKVVEKKKEE